MQVFFAANSHNFIALPKNIKLFKIAPKGTA
jgi:hypothetical protein